MKKAAYKPQTKKMKNIAVIILIVFAGCATVRETHQHKVHHVVLCWLKDSGNAVQRRQIIEASRSFQKIPGVLDVRAGEVMESDSKVADKTFDVAITLSFENEKGLAAYIANPIHKKAKDEILLPIIKRIMVYDFKE